MHTNTAFYVYVERHVVVAHSRDAIHREPRVRESCAAFSYSALPLTHSHTHTHHTTHI